MSAVLRETQQELLGADALRANPNAPVMVCADLRALQYADKLAGNIYACVTWHGDWRDYDWSLLTDRKILVWCEIWPLAVHLATQTDKAKILLSDVTPEDFEEYADFKAWAVEHVQELTRESAISEQARLEAMPPEPVESEPEQAFDAPDMPPYEPPGEPLKTDPAALPFVWARDVSDHEDGSHEILEGVLTAGAMSVWYGESNSGKTYLVLDLARAIAKGDEWLGKRTRQGCVIYVAAEGSKTIERRIRAIRKEFGDSDFPLGVVKTSINMCGSSADTEALAVLVNDRASEIDMPVSLVIVDTLSRAMAGGNENDSVDMGLLVKNGDTLRELTGAHLAWIHHTGKDVARGARGHSLLRAATDTEVEISHDAATGIRTAKVTKQRDLDSNGNELFAKLRGVELGKNEWGTAITACVVEAIGAQDRPRPTRKPVTGNALRALTICREIAGINGLTNETSKIPKSKKLVDYDAFVEKFRSASPPQKDGSFRGTCSRVLQKLQDDGYIGIHNNIMWLE